MSEFQFDEHTQSVIEKSVVPIVIYQIVYGHVVTVAASKGYCRMFGYKDLKEAAEKTDGNLFRNVHPDDLDRVTQAASGFIRENKPFNLVYRFMTEGGCRFIHVCGEQIAAETGEQLAVIWYIDDNAVIPDSKAADNEEELKESEKERESTDILSALSDNYLCVFTVDMPSGCFSAYEISDLFKEIGVLNEGDDFFTAIQNSVLKYVHPEDMDKFINVFTHDNVTRVVRENGMFAMEFRVIIHSDPMFICIKAAKNTDNEQEMVLGFVNIDAQKKREILFENNLSAAWENANRDALTGVKSKHNFDNYKEKLQEIIEQTEMPQIALGVFNCNDLRKINAQYGHDKGNTYLIASCRLICKVFKHSPVFRVGGDEFIVVLQREDYHNLDELLQQFMDEQSRLISTAKNPWEKVSVSFGIAVYCPQLDSSIEDLIHRADQLMYDDKRAKKAK